MRMFKLPKCTSPAGRHHWPLSWAQFMAMGKGTHKEKCKRCGLVRLRVGTTSQVIGYVTDSKPPTKQELNGGWVQGYANTDSMKGWRHDDKT